MKKIENKKVEKDIEKRIKKISKEMEKGLKVVAKNPKTITIFGSARTKKTDPYYKKAESIAEKISQEGFSVITGGGPGIMEAGSKGAKKNKKSLGFTIKLPFEQKSNIYLDQEVSFYYFFSRKFSMTFSGEAYIFFPGGFGTLDEFFEVITLVQTKKMPQVPLILVGKDYWQPLFKFFENSLLKKFKTISKKDLDLFVITDNEEEILKIIKNSKTINEFNI